MAPSDRIQNMMRTFSGGTDSGFLACIDIVKAHFEPNPIALESVLYTMLDGFYNTGKETICQYILDNYIFDEDCGADLSDAIRIRAPRHHQPAAGQDPAQLPNRQMGRWFIGFVQNVRPKRIHPAHVLGILVPQVRTRDPKLGSGILQIRLQGIRNCRSQPGPSAQTRGRKPSATTA